MTPREGATPTPMMFKLRPRAISPTSTAIFPVPISTAPTMRLLLEITLAFPLRGLDLKRGLRRHGQLVRRVLEPHRHLAVEREVDGLERRVRQPARRVDDVVQPGDLLEEIILPAENDLRDVLRAHDDLVVRGQPRQRHNR